MKSLLHLKTALCAAIMLPACLAMAGQESDKALFEEVEAKLDKGGSFYLYMTTDDIAKKLKDFIDFFKAMADKQSENDEDAQYAANGIGVLKTLIKASGIGSVDAFGMSSVKLSDNLYRDKMFVHCQKGAAKGFFWDLYGKAPHELDALKLMPSTTSVAVASDLDLNMLRDSLKAAFRKNSHSQILKKMEEAEAEAKGQGFDVDAMLKSYDGVLGYMITLDKSKAMPFPMPNVDEPIQFPMPGFAAFMKVKDDAIYNAILAKVPGMQPLERKGAKAASYIIPAPIPLPVQLCLARKGDYLIFAASYDMLDSILATMDGAPGLAQTENFKRLSKGVSLKGNAIVYVDKAFMDTVTKAQGMAIAASEGEDGEMMQKMYSMMGMNLEMLSVMSRIPDGGICSDGYSSNGYSNMVATQGIAPMAIVAGMTLPALSSAREKAKRISCAANLKQIGLAIKQYSIDYQDKFPEKSGAEGLEQLRSGRYIDDPKVFVCPSDKCDIAAPGKPLTEDNVSYVYLGGFTEEVSPDMPLAFDKPDNHSKYVNVLFADGHVQGYPMIQAESCLAIVKRLLEVGGLDLSEDEAKLLLEKAALADIAIKAPKPARQQESPATK